MCKTIGKYIPASENQPEIIEKDWYGQGMIYKNWDAYENHPSEVCYIPELSDSKYTRKDIVEMCHGNEELAKEVFQCLDWQHPESLIEDWMCNDDIVVCEKCGWMFDYYGHETCPKCGTEYEE